MHYFSRKKALLAASLAALSGLAAAGTASAMSIEVPPALVVRPVDSTKVDGDVTKTARYNPMEVITLVNSSVTAESISPQAVAWVTAPDPEPVVDRTIFCSHAVRAPRIDKLLPAPVRASSGIERTTIKAALQNQRSVWRSHQLGQNLGLTTKSG